MQINIPIFSNYYCYNGIRLFFIKKSIAFIFLILLASYSKAQIPFDTFQSRVNTLASDQPDLAGRITDSLLLITDESIEPARAASLLMIKGKVARIKADLKASLRFYIEAYNFYEKAKDKAGKITSLITIGTLHINLENLDRADFYLNKALAMTDTSDYKNLNYIYNNLGVIYSDMGNENKAIKMYLKVIPITLAQKDYYTSSVIYHNISNCYSKLNDFDNAVKYELIALNFQRKNGDKELLATITNELGALYIEFKKDFRKAEYYLSIGGKASYESNSIYQIRAYLGNMYTLNKEKGKPELALNYLEKLNAVNDTIYIRESRDEALKVEAQFKNDLTIKELERVTFEKAAIDAKLEKHKFQKRVFVAILIVLLCFAVIMYRNYLLKQKANQLLETDKQLTELKNKFLLEQNKQLENENVIAQYKTLREQVSPHFLFNSINTLASLIKSNSPKSLEFINMFSKLFRNVLEIKDRQLIEISEELNHVNTYIYLQRMRFGESLLLDTHIDATLLEQYIPPFTLQMIVENAIKHNIVTEQNPLKIEIYSDGQFIIIRNNLQTRSVMEESTKTGIVNIISRYRYLSDIPPEFFVDNQYYYAKIPIIKE